ncbi:MULTISPECIES: hypothetical protein [unclassified Chitinophaga]|uniref:hypothetical protein n=1 Tax=unclassified Chitinophaga TaxID=2619133 RepID=UPI00300FBE9D
MTSASYHIIRKALIDQRNLVAQSQEEATKLIDDLGIRSILITDGDGNKTTKPAAKKAAAKKKAATR